MLEETKKELACEKCESDAIQLKLDSYSNSRYVLDHIIDIQKKKGDVKCIGYQSCPLSIRHNYTKMPDEEDMPHFEPSVSLDVKEFAVGLGYKKDISSNQAQPADLKDSTTVRNQDPPVIVEDCDSSDDEPNEDEARQSNMVTKEANIPLENHILYDHPVKLCVTAPIKHAEACGETCESASLHYTLIGSDKVYSNKDFPIQNINQSLIDKVFEDSTSKLLGKLSPRVMVTPSVLLSQKPKFENNMEIKKTSRSTKARSH
ncbi:hypothetical protein Hanom_Chr09g00770271 [Helianthus anomalus]